MATPATPSLPAGATARHIQLFNELPDDDTKRGYLLFLEEYDGGARGANRLLRGWNTQSAAAQQDWISSANAPALPGGPAQEDSETSSGWYTPPMEGQIVRPPRGNGAGSRGDAPGDDQGVADVNPQVGAANAIPNEPGNETNISDYEPSDSEINKEKEGLTQAHTHEEPPRSTRQRETETALDDWVQPWRFCRTLYKTSTRENADPESTVVCLYALCDENGAIVHVSISSNNLAYSC
jgi:hypothetical protein